MNLFLETLLVFGKLIWLWLVSIVRRIASSLGLLSYKDISGEVVLVTGAASGLGRLMALEFAKRKATVVLWDMNEEGNKAVADEIRALGRDAFPYKCDLSKREEIYSVAEAVKADVGDVTMLVNNAGIATGKKFMDSSDGLIQKTFEVNAIAHFWTLKAFLPSMLENNHGHIVTIASAAGLFASAGLVDYCASKFAAVGATEALRLELRATGKTGIKTTCICPFFINTGMFEGVKTRFPSLLPIVSPEYAVEQIMRGILTDDCLVLFPSSLYSTFALKGVLPVNCASVLSDFLGADHLMDSFVQTRPKQA